MSLGFNQEYTAAIKLGQCIPLRPTFRPEVQERLPKAGQTEEIEKGTITIFSVAVRFQRRPPEYSLLAACLDQNRGFQ